MYRLRPDFRQFLSSSEFTPSPNLVVHQSLSEFTPSPNLSYRSMLRSEMDHIFSRLVEECYTDLKNYAFIRPLKGDARTDYGDYVCLSVLEVCEELRKDDPDLFDEKSPKEIAKEILSGFQFEKTNMINQESIQVHDAGIITFQLDGSWIAHRIDEMLINGIDTWAPKLYNRQAKAIFLSTHNLGVNNLRATYMKHALADIFLYSGIDVLVFPTNKVNVDVPTTIGYGVDYHKADVVIYVAPHLEREYIEECFTAARNTEWFRAREATLACCGYRCLSFDQARNLALLWEYFSRTEFTSLFGMAKDFGYTPDKFFGCLLKYTLLKSYRLAEVTFSMDELIDQDGNTLVNILLTTARISYIIKNSISPGKLSKSEKALAGKGERELGLHLVEFTGVIEKACKSFVPHIVCEYLFDLSMLFRSYCPEFGKANVPLCKATEVVMFKCIRLLGIYKPARHARLRRFMSLVERVVETSANDHRFSRSRFELFTMRVGVAHPDFDKGSIFGNIWVKDANLARADGWTKTDGKDCCYVSYFNHEWHKPLDISYDSCIPFGDPSCRRSVPVSSSLEVHVLLHAMSENKQHCYLVFHGKHDERLSKFWHKEPTTERGTLELESDVGRVLINYILLKYAVDASMEMMFRSSNPNARVKICGSIMAYYGDDVVKDDGGILGEYKAIIFRTNNFELTGEQVMLPLHKSLLAVPASGCLKIEALLKDFESEEEYVHDTRDYRAMPGETDNWPIECGNFSFNLKVAWS